MVRELVASHGPKQWTMIAQHLKGRIGKQCRERWYNHLDPAIKKTPFTVDEDELILREHLRVGT